MKQKQATQLVPEGRTKKTGRDSGVTVTVDVGHKSEFNNSITRNANVSITVYNDNTIADYSDTQFDWSLIGHNTETILEGVTKHYCNRLAETTIVIAAVESENGYTHTPFAVSDGIISALKEL